MGAPDLEHTTSRGVAVAVNVVVFVLTGASVATAFLAALPRAAGAPPTSSAVFSPASSFQSDPFIVSAGIASTAPPAANQAAFPAISVHAIRTGPEAEAAAILSVGGGEQKRIAMGEEVAPGLTLKSVRTTSVLIAAGGRDIEIPLFSGSGDGRPPLPATGNPPLRLSQDGDEFKIFTAPTSGRLASIGLMPGDTVRAINGEDLIRERLDEQLGLLSQPRGATITIERDGRTETLVIGEAQ